MSGRYYLTGVQLGMLMRETDEGIRMKIISYRKKLTNVTSPISSGVLLVGSRYLEKKE